MANSTLNFKNGQVPAGPTSPAFDHSFMVRGAHRKWYFESPLNLENSENAQFGKLISISSLYGFYRNNRQPQPRP